MSKVIKAILTGIVFISEYIFTTIIYPNIQEALALQQADNPDIAFEGLQFFQLVHTYEWIIIILLLGVIWSKEIRGVLRKID
ncbi:MAG: hypothetical protein N4A57_18335 [Anaeromicrobium sp.]|uniref:hypothetical protein n=1 Tax=Anaeromicrobium sp. TaxID=1929132 RepID=UPI0025E74C2F|nr:hypothetical protein [Anaeromicrobium sp.]MCT4596209.1 hypothetical protein [Anaeromicrobium sp.]